MHVDFEPLSKTDPQHFSKSLKTELELRTHNKKDLASVLSSSLEEKRARLKSFLTQEAEIDLARKTMSRHEMVNAVVTMLVIGAAIPCVLHVEMRVSEKPFWTSLAMAMDRHLGGDNSKRNLFVERATDNTIIGGVAPGRKSQWVFPLKEDGKQVDPRTMTNTHSGKCTMGLKTIASLVFSADQMSHLSLLITQDWKMLGSSRVGVGL